MYTHYETGVYGNGLSKRELMVLELVTAGLTNIEIGDAMCVSPHTARTHVERIADRLGVHNRTTMAAYALVYGLVNVERIEALWGVYRPELMMP